MKLAAVLIPIALFIFPTIALVVISFVSSLSYLKTGKDTNSVSRPISARTRRQLLVLSYGYILVLLPASITWAIHVYTGNIWIAVGFYFIWALPMTIMMVVQRRTMPKPPPGGWPDDKARVDALTKWRDDRQERASDPKYLKRIFIISFAISLVMAIIGAIIAFSIGK